jgi:hypothetical protein
MAPVGLPDSLPEQLYLLSYRPERGRFGHVPELGLALRAAALADLLRRGLLSDVGGKVRTDGTPPARLDPLLSGTARLARCRPAGAAPTGSVSPSSPRPSLPSRPRCTALSKPARPRTAAAAEGGSAAAEGRPASAAGHTRCPQPGQKAAVSGSSAWQAVQARGWASAWPQAAQKRPPWVSAWHCGQTS